MKIIYGLIFLTGIGSGFFWGKATKPDATTSPPEVPQVQLGPKNPILVQPESQAFKTSSEVKNSKPAATSIHELVHRKTGVERLSAILNSIVGKSQQELPSVSQDIAKAFVDGFLTKTDYALLMEAVGSQCDPSTALSILSGPSIKNDGDGIQSFMSGWTSKSPAAAVDFMKNRNGLQGKEITDFNLAKGIVTRLAQDSPFIAELSKSFPNLKESMNYWKTESDARSHGFETAISNAIKSPSSDNETFIRLEALGTLAGIAGDTAFMKYVDSTIGSENDIGINGSKVNIKFAQRDYNQSYQYALKMKSGDNRTGLLSSSVFQAGLKDPDAAIDLVKNTPPGTKEEQKYLIYALEDAFRQSKAITKEELPDLMQQTQALINQLKK